MMSWVHTAMPRIGRMEHIMYLYIGRGKKFVSIDNFSDSHEDFDRNMIFIA